MTDTPPDTRARLDAGIPGREWMQHKPTCHVMTGVPFEWKDINDRTWRNNVPCTCGLDAFLASQRVRRDELTLIREAAADTSLSDGAVRCIAAGLEPPTAEDIERATRELGKAEDPSRG